LLGSVTAENSRAFDTRALSVTSPDPGPRASTRFLR
jgi:hypothetical protein